MALVSKQSLLPHCPEVAFEAKDQLFQRKMHFEFDLQDGVLLKSSVIVLRMTDLPALSRRAGVLPHSNFWEALILEIKSLSKFLARKRPLSLIGPSMQARLVFSFAQLIEQ